MNDDEILDAISEKLDCKHYGHYLSAICIFHNDSRPSLMIYPDTYKCLSCGAYGKTSKLLDSLSNTVLVVQPNKPDYKNPWTKWTKSMELKDVLIQSWKTLNNTPSLGNYLYKRGISASVCKKLGIGYREDWYTIPILDKNNKVAGAVARANAETNHAPSKYIFPYGQSTNLLYVPSWKKVLQSSYVYLTFGILDAVSLYILGEPSMSTTGGKQLNPDALDWCRKEIRVIPDFGEIKESMMLTKELGWRGKTIDLDYPEGCKDINDIYSHGLNVMGLLT